MKHNPSEIETQSFLSWALESKPILFQAQTAASCFELDRLRMKKKMKKPDRDEDDELFVRFVF